jgi:hypothetical protein
MKIERRWFLGMTALLFPLLSSSIAKGDGQEEETRVRWDIIHFTSFNPPTVEAGGRSAALAEDMSKLTLSGSGTFVVGDSEEVTGGGTWEIRDRGGNLTGSGTYRVTRLVRWEVAPGRPGPALVDRIGNVADLRAGLAHLRIRYSDGSQGILIVSCHLLTSPDAIFEGITASKGFVDFWSRAGPNGTLFHAISEGED